MKPAYRMFNSGHRGAVKKALADLVLASHLIIILFAVFGALCVFGNPLFTLLHVIVVAWSSLVNLAGWTCPLTPLEQNLRKAAGGDSYSGGCLYHYLNPLVRPLGMPRRMELVAGFTIVCWNLVVYLVLFLRNP